MAHLSQLTDLDKLERVEVYEFYDQPVLFSCRNTLSQLFLAVFADEDDDFETWLYAGMSRHRFEQIRSGEIDLHDAFSETEDGIVFEVKIPFDEGKKISFGSIPSGAISEDLLPLPGEFLNLGTKALPELDDNLNRKAAQTKQEPIREKSQELAAL